MENLWLHFFPQDIRQATVGLENRLSRLGSMLLKSRKGARDASWEPHFGHPFLLPLPLPLPN